MSIKNMAFGMALGKDERKWQLGEEIRQRKTLTVSSCARSIGVSQSTIRTYLKEINMAIYDDETKELTKVYNKETQIVYPF